MTHRVRHMVLPSIKKLLPMWQGKFRFVPFTIEEQKARWHGGRGHCMGGPPARNPARSAHPKPACPAPS